MCNRRITRCPEQGNEAKSNQRTNATMDNWLLKPFLLTPFGKRILHCLPADEGDETKQAGEDIEEGYPLQAVDDGR